MKRGIPLVVLLVALGVATVSPSVRLLPPEADVGPAVAEAAAEPQLESGLGPYLALAGQAQPPAAAEEALRDGLARSQAGDAAGARAAFARAAALFPGLADWTTYLAAEAAARAGDTALVDELLAGAEPDLARERGWRLRTRALAEARDTAAAVRAALEAAQALEEGGARAAAWLRAARYRLAAADTAGAREALAGAIDAGPHSEHALDAARLLSAFPRLTGAEHLRVGRLYLRNGNLERGQAGIDAYLAAGSKDAAARAEARLELGRALFQARRYADAARRLSSLANDATAPAETAAEALLLAGRAQYRDGRTTVAGETLRRVAAKFPSERAAAEALFILADLAHDERKLASARELYRRSIATRPETDAAGEAAVRLGGLAYLEGDFAETARVFEAYRAAHADGGRAQQAAYWAARARLAAGEEAAAAEWLEKAVRLDAASYYGIRAADLLGREWSAALAPSPETDADVAREVRGALVRLDLLGALGLTESAAFELERVKRHLALRPGGTYALAEALHERGETFRAIRLGREIRRTEGAWNERLLRIVYPFPYRETIVAEARRNGLDPYLVAGLIRQESMFNPNAVSPVGATGLMQLMPRTGGALAKRTGAARKISPETLKQPELNVRLGTVHVADLLGWYGSPADMLAAYNAGASRLARWKSHPEYSDPDLFVERIPYEETREYVKIVQQNARIYRALYGGLERAVHTSD